MPCYTPPDEVDVLADKMPPVLCGLVRVMGTEQIVAMIDWEEVGVKKEDFLRWWQLHKEEDEARERREQEEKAALEALDNRWKAALPELAKVTLIHEELRSVNPFRSMDVEKKLMMIDECRKNFSYFVWLVNTFRPGKPNHFITGMPEYGAMRLQMRNDELKDSGVIR